MVATSLPFECVPPGNDTLDIVQTVQNPSFQPLEWLSISCRYDRYVDNGLLERGLSRYSGSLDMDSIEARVTILVSCLGCNIF